jgi:hypothetical protein
MVEFKRKSIGRDSFGVSHFYFQADGLPAGVSCSYHPEDADRPRGEWFVVAVRAGRKRIIRCPSKTAASKAAMKWCISKKKGGR